MSRDLGPPERERNDIFPSRTDRERATDYLKRSRPNRPKAPPQAEALFDEPEHQQRRLVPVVAPEPLELFPEPARTDRTLVPVANWPDYQSLSGNGGGDHA